MGVGAGIDGVPLTRNIDNRPDTLTVSATLSSRRYNSLANTAPHRAYNGELNLSIRAKKY